MNESEGWEGLERNAIESSSRKVLNPSEGLFEGGEAYNEENGKDTREQSWDLPNAGCLIKINGLAGSHRGLLSQYLSHENQKVQWIGVEEGLVFGTFD